MIIYYVRSSHDVFTYQKLVWRGNHDNKLVHMGQLYRIRCAFGHAEQDGAAPLPRRDLPARALRRVPGGLA